MKYIDDLVTVVVPVYNAEKYLDVCVQSILSQTYSDIEVLLVDDGSQDNSYAICKKYQDNDNRVTAFHKQNGGLTSARRYGFHEAHGEYIVFFDSDDVVSAAYIEEQLDNIKKKNADISICEYYVRNSQSEKKWHIKHSKTLYYKDTFLRELILPNIWTFNSDNTHIPNFLWLRLMKTKLVTDKCFYSEREVYTEDIFFNIEYLKNSQSVAILDKPLYYYCVRPETLTHRHRENRAKMEIQRIQFLRKALLSFGFDDEIRLELSAFRGIGGCINNAFYLGDYHSFKKEVRDVLSMKEVTKILSDTPFKYLSLSERIRYIGCRMRLYRMLYYFESKMAL